MNHPLHALCPYFAMFPPAFVLDQLLAYSASGDLVLDPFSGRGTTVLESLLNNRRAIATDINLVAACISGAKAQVPSHKALKLRIDELRERYSSEIDFCDEISEFFALCFHRETLGEILFLRRELQWRTDPVDCFIAALVLGALHGESHRSSLCLSNRMPRTISTKPDYSVRWWKDKGYVAPLRKTFDVLLETAGMRFAKAPPSLSGLIRLSDARRASDVFAEFHGSVDLVVTSPPYLDTTDFAEDQWLRLWFLGGHAKPIARLNIDDRHTRIDKYWTFLTEAWSGCKLLMKPNCTIVIRIGGPVAKEEMVERLTTTLVAGLPDRNISLHNLSSSDIRKRQTNVFRPGTSEGRQEHDFVFSSMQ